MILLDFWATVAYVKLKRGDTKRLEPVLILQKEVVEVPVLP